MRGRRDLFYEGNHIMDDLNKLRYILWTVPRHYTTDNRIKLQEQKGILCNKISFHFKKKSMKYIISLLKTRAASNEKTHYKPHFFPH